MSNNTFIYFVTDVGRA